MVYEVVLYSNLANPIPKPTRKPRAAAAPRAPAMSATAAAIRSGDVLACPVVALRRATAVSFRMRRGAAMRGVVAAASAEGAEAVEGGEKGKGKKKKRAASGIMKPKPISAELREFVGGAEELPRTEALKIIWAHIKGNNLQDPNNKKIIVCDEKLKKIFGGRDRVGFLEISGKEYQRVLLHRMLSWLKPGRKNVFLQI
uniref:DM2 domain-containing protein n=1 Tax=Leersia perrieri TaxID=77586 RepID=A0A0D9XZP5_9ORYZ